MGLFSWLRPKTQTRLGSAIARDLAEAAFSMHPSAKDRIVLTLGDGVVTSMDVPEIDPTREFTASVDLAVETARISELAMELANCPAPTCGHTLIVMRDRVVWMPSVLTFNPSVP